MKKQFSNSWKSSKKPRKQRKYRENAPLHIKHKMLSAPLSKDLKKKYERKNLPVKRGDTVKIMRGSYKKKTGKISKVMVKLGMVYLDGIENIKKDGSKKPYPIHPSNLMITELNLDDKKRQKTLERTKNE